MWKLRWAKLSLFSISLLAAGCGPRSQSLQIDGIQAEIWVEDALVRIDQPIELRFSVTNENSVPIQLAGPEAGPAADLVVRVPDPSRGWVQVWRWSQDNAASSLVQLAPGESLTLKGTWALSADLNSDAVIVVGLVGYAGRTHEVSVGIAETLGTF